MKNNNTQQNPSQPLFTRANIENIDTASLHADGSSQSKKEEGGIRKKVGDAIEKIGDKVEHSGFKKVGDAIERFGDKIEHSGDRNKPKA